MMSILGATADDMEEILKGLGYRAEPKPAAEVKARLEAQDNAAREAAAAKLAAEEAARAEQARAAEAATAEAGAEVSAEGSEPGTDAAVVTEATVEVPAEPVADVAAEPVAEQQAEAPAEVTEEAPLAAEAVAERPAEAAPAAKPEAEAKAPEVEMAAGEPDAEISPATEAVPAEPAVAAEAVSGEATVEASEPKPILLWRQGRFDQRPRNRHHDNRARQRNGQVARDGRTDAPTDAVGAQPTGTPGDRPAHEGRRNQREGAGKPRFDRSKFKPKPQGEGGERREGKPQGERPDRRENRADWKGGRPEGKGGQQGAKPAFQPKPREERPVRFDPDSPFAKLAALRDQLKK
jgi:ATP-dependent RNA helicase SUPV3L1/SUV3